MLCKFTECDIWNLDTSQDFHEFSLCVERKMNALLIENIKQVWNKESPNIVYLIIILFPIRIPSLLFSCIRPWNSHPHIVQSDFERKQYLAIFD